MSLAQAEPGEIVEHASALVGWRVLSIAAVRRGGNNRVFQLTGRRTRALLKIYPTQAEDPRDRLGQEFGALTFLAEAGVAEVPRPIACDRTLHCAVYEWLDGAPPCEVGAAEIGELADFFIRLQQLRERPGAADLREGATPVLSPVGLAGQLKQRLQRLAEVVKPGTEVAHFVATELTPAAERALDYLRHGCEVAGIDFAATLAPALRVLSPSDFGFHNAVRRPTGRLAFVDFEFFGWDGPEKAAADVMLHAGMALSPELRQLYHARVSSVLERTDPQFPLRFRLFFPALRTIWCLILLNEFLPERWARRVLAGVVADRAQVEAQQLVRARAMLRTELAS